MNCTVGSTQYEGRAGILKEFEAENLNLPESDPLRDSYPALCDSEPDVRHA